MKFSDYFNMVGTEAYVNNLEAVFAPVLDVDQCVVERRTVVALKVVALAQVFGGGVNIRSNN